MYRSTVKVPFNTRFEVDSEGSLKSFGEVDITAKGILFILFQTYLKLCINKYSHSHQNLQKKRERSVFSCSDSNIFCLKLSSL